MARDWRIGIIGVALLAELLLTYALFGKPPYVFYSLLKWTVAASTALGASALWLQSRRYLPISVFLLLMGGVHLFGRMRRSEWVMFNWSAAAGLLVMVVILVISLRRSGSTAFNGQGYPSAAVINGCDEILGADEIRMSDG